MGLSPVFCVMIICIGHFAMNAIIDDSEEDHKFMTCGVRGGIERLPGTSWQVDGVCVQKQCAIVDGEATILRKRCKRRNVPVFQNCTGRQVVIKPFPACCNDKPCRH